MKTEFTKLTELERRWRFAPGSSAILLILSNSASGRCQLTNLISIGNYRKPVAEIDSGTDSGTGCIEIGGSVEHLQNRKRLLQIPSEENQQPQRFLIHCHCVGAQHAEKC